MRSSLETRRRRSGAGFWRALNTILVVLVALGLLAVVVVQFYPQIEYRNKMVRELDQKKHDLAAEEQVNKQRTREVYLLENDKQYIETIARDKLDMMKEGETIYRLDPAKSGTAKNP